MTKTGSTLFAIFFLLMITLPTVMVVERGIFLAVLFIGSVIYIAYNPKEWRVRKELMAWLLICIALASSQMLNGIIRSAPGALHVSTIYIIWPILFLFFIGLSRNIDIHVKVQKALIIGTAIASTTAIALVLSAVFPWLSIFSPYFDLLGANVGYYEGQIKFTIYTMTTIIYGLPYIISLLMLGNSAPSIMQSKWALLSKIVIGMSILAMLVSGRKAFVIAGMLSFLLSAVIMHITAIKKISFPTITSYVIHILAIAILASAGIIYFELDIGVMLEEFLNGFDFSDPDNESAYRRREQFFHLLQGWKEAPIFGKGLGAAAADNVGLEVTRDSAPWAYELYYLALLFQTGIVGLFIYSAAIFWLTRKMLTLAKKYRDMAGLIIPSLVGMLCFLVANATNPYLSKFDYLWAIFIPVGLVNVGLIRLNQENRGK